MTALALRHVPRGEVTQLLTERVANARDLPGVLAWRLGQMLTAARRDQSRQVPADEDGTGTPRCSPPGVTHQAQAHGPRSPPHGPSSTRSGGESGTGDGTGRQVEIRARMRARRAAARRPRAARHAARSQDGPDCR